MPRWGAPNPLGGGLVLGGDGAVQQTVFAPPPLHPTLASRLQNQPERVSTLTLEVREGGVLRATRTYTPDAERYAFSLTQGERDSVVVWADIELWLIADGGTRAVLVRRAQMRAPMAPQTITAAALTLTATARTATAVRGAITQQGVRLQTTATARPAATAPGALTQQASPLGLTGTARTAASVLGALAQQAASLGLTASARTAAASLGARTVQAVRLQVLAALRSGTTVRDSTLTAELREGGVLRATRTYLPDGTRAVFTLTQGERDSVLVWADAELWLVATGGTRAVRVRRTAFVTQSTLTLEARESGVLRASRTWTPTGARQTITLTPAEQASITSWTALEWWLTANGGSRAIRIRRARGMVVVAGTPSTLTLELREGGVLRVTRDITPDDPPAEDPYGTATRWVFELTDAELASVGTWANLEAWLVADGGTRPIRVRRIRILTPTGQIITASRLQLTATPRAAASVKGALTKTAAVLPLVSTPRIGSAVPGAVTRTGAAVTMTATARSATTTFGAVTRTGTRLTLTTTARSASPTFGAKTTTGARFLLTGTLRAATLNMQVSRAFGVPTESRGRVATTASPAAETLLLVTAAPTVPLETRVGLVATRIAASEWRGRVVSTAVVPVESRGLALVLQSFAVPVESRGRVVAALEVEAESLQPVAVAWTAAMETLLTVVAEPSPGSESRVGVVAARLPATEWRQRVVATAVVPVESLALSGVVQAFAIPTEWRSWVASLHSPEAESKQPVAVSAVLAAEHRLRVARAFTADVEARGGVRATYLVPVESWGVVVALLIRLLDVRLGVSVLDDVALTPGAATLAALRPSVLDALTWGVAEADDAALDVPTLADLAMATP